MKTNTKHYFNAFFCILAITAAAPLSFSADGDKDFEKGQFAMEQGDNDTAESYFAKAAEKGHAEAANTLGVIRHNQKQYEEAFKLFKQAVEQGFEPAAKNLAQYYSVGLGCERNDNEAFKLFLKLAEGGDADAQSTVGARYYRGKGVEKNTDEAVKWLKKAAEQRVPDALVNLGLFYLWGSGVPKDEKEAFSLFKKAAEQRDEEAFYHLGNCYFQGIGTEKNLKVAQECFIKAKDWMLEMAANDNDIAFQLGCLGYWGVDCHDICKDLVKEYNEIVRKNKFELTEKDRKFLERYEDNFARYHKDEQLVDDAIKALTFAAEKGHADSQYALAKLLLTDISFILYKEKLLDETDKMAMAVHWNTKAAENGNVHAQYDLAEYYMEKNNKEEAAKWFRRAAENGVISAQWKLAEESKDEKDVLEWTKKTAGHSLSELRKERILLKERFWPYETVMSYKRYHSAHHRLEVEASYLILAYYNLGNAYANGKGVEEDDAEAVKWLKLAAEASLDEKEMRGNLKDNSAIAAAIGNAQYTLGMYYEKGWGVEKDLQEAIKWYKKALTSEDFTIKRKARNALNRLEQI